MSKFHVRRDQMERFLRGESSQQENREIIRHLLAECELCQETVREAASRQGFKVTAEAEAPVVRIAG
ncbi:MAG TPA: hypothetical protein VKM72_04645 [Thermoanaerobaculia bacterium]|nr:hypothetical protein [Thermoanaerobaculia bacterium]